MLSLTKSYISKTSDPW
uniref:Uncharacterized protein n=1 Tax=Anguilla anguilla TaxID=7936 RepID=A0A0E9W299_ANGAN